MKYWWILLLMWVTPLMGATYPSPTASQADVQATINDIRVGDGDTVTIPAGTVTWSSTLSITKCINLIGAGTNVPGGTIITAGVDRIISWKPYADKAVRLSAIRFESGGNVSTIGAETAVCFFGPATKIRVDHCFFNTGDSPCTFNRWNTGGTASTGTGPCYGVLDHCTWRSIRRQFICQDVGDGGVASWSWAVLPGTVNSVVFEDDIFSQQSDTYNNADCVFYGQYGSRMMVRNCVFSGASNGYFDAHSGPPDAPGVVLYEVYNNTMTHGSYPGGGSSSEFWMRGGQCLFYNNTSDYGTMAGLTVYYAPPGFAHPPTNCFFWNNTFANDSNDGPACDVTAGNAHSGVTGVHYCDVPTCECTPTYVVKDTHYFGHAPQVGNNFYPYTALAYPHPLINDTPVAPTITTDLTSGVTNSVGANIGLVINATGATGYQWRQNTNVLAGFTGNVLSSNNVQTTTSGWYDCVATNNAGAGLSRTSSIVYVQITNLPPYVPIPPPTNFSAFPTYRKVIR